MVSFPDIKKMMAGVLTAFLAILVLRIVWPIINMVMSMWTQNSMLKLVANLAFWLIVLSALYIGVFRVLFGKPQPEM